MMKSLFKTESVTIHTPTSSQTDPFGKVVAEFQNTTLDGVLIQPKATNDFTDDIRPDGIEVRLVIHIPKSYTSSLEGCEITARGERYKVIGSPQCFIPENTPNDWNRACEVGVIHG